MMELIEKFRDQVPPPVLPTARYVRAYITPRYLVDLYFRRRPRLTERFAILMCAKRGAPIGWSWERHIADMRQRWPWTANFSFREPPRPYQFSAGPGHCCLCGGPVYALGWHRPWGKHQQVNGRASWHAACGSAYSRWTNPGFGLSAGFEADHFIPLYRVYRELGRDGRWPDILWYWSHRNIHVLTAEQHRLKSAREAAERARFRIVAPPIVPLLFADEVSA
jgi:hypothetical protein